MRWSWFVWMYVRKEKTMARLKWLLLAACILTCLPRESDAGDVFTGFQVDDKNQYFIYLGVPPLHGAFSPAHWHAGTCP